jgi:uncharacterized protein (DUF1684 family)
VAAPSPTTRRGSRPGGLSTLAAALLLLAGCRGEERAGSGAAPSPSPAAEAGDVSAEHRADVEAWKQGRLQRLTAPDGWLSLVGLEWIEEGTNRLGSAPDAEVAFPAKAPPRMGVIERRGEALAFTPEPGVEVLAGEPPAPITGRLELRSDLSGEPTMLRHGTFLFHVIQRGDRFALRVKDSESPVRTGFQGLEHYPVRADWRITARFEPAPPGTTIAVPNILGTVDDSPSQGTVVFEREGREARLAAIDEGDGRLFLVFGDETNGKTTYGGGRFVYADPPAPGETTVVVDFNKSYNPPCVFTAYSTCPLPPRSNRLPYPLEAGEKLWAGYEHREEPPAGS